MTIDAYTIQTRQWADATVANSKLHDMLLLVTGADALGIVEGVPNQGFEAWRLLNESCNRVGEMYTYDKMNSLIPISG